MSQKLHSSWYLSANHLDNCVRSNGGLTLASISCLATIEICSKCQHAGEYMVTLGHQHCQAPIQSSRIHRSSGTHVYVKNMFFNMPVRRKCLRPSYEMIKVKEFVTKMSILHHNVLWKVSDRSSRQFCCRLQHAESVMSRINDIYGSEITSKLKEINCQFSASSSLSLNSISISGLISTPGRRNQSSNSVKECCDLSNGCQHCFINGRWARTVPQGNIASCNTSAGIICGTLDSVYRNMMLNLDNGCSSSSNSLKSSVKGIVRRGSGPSAKHSSRGCDNSEISPSLLFPCFILLISCPDEILDWGEDSVVSFVDPQLIVSGLQDMVQNQCGQSFDYFAPDGKCDGRPHDGRATLFTIHSHSTSSGKVLSAFSPVEKPTKISSRMFQSKNTPACDFLNMTFLGGNHHELAVASYDGPLESKGNCDRSLIIGNEVQESLSQHSKQSLDGKIGVSINRKNISTFDERWCDVMCNVDMESSDNNFVHTQQHTILEGDACMLGSHNGVLHQPVEYMAPPEINDDAFVQTIPLISSKDDVPFYAVDIEECSMDMDDVLVPTTLPLDDDDGDDDFFSERPLLAAFGEEYDPPLSSVADESLPTVPFASPMAPLSTVGLLGAEATIPPSVPSVAPPAALPNKCNKVLKKSSLRNLRVIGQVENKYVIVCSLSDNCILCIDQHAADERILLELLEKDAIPSIDNEFPYSTSSDSVRKVNERLDVSFQVEKLVDIILNPTHLSLLSNWGFHVAVIDNVVGVATDLCTSMNSRHGKRKYSNKENVAKMENSRAPYSLHLQQVPVVAGEPLSGDDFIEFLEFILKHENLPKCLMRPPAVWRILSSKACRKAIKFGDSLTKCQCETLVSRLSTALLPFQCAHGRPSIVPLCSMPTVVSNRVSSRKSEENRQVFPSSLYCVKPKYSSLVR